jgi:hypothetical protein
MVSQPTSIAITCHCGAKGILSGMVAAHANSGAGKGFPPNEFAKQSLLPRALILLEKIAINKFMIDFKRLFQALLA